MHVPFVWVQELAKRIFPLCESYILIDQFVESRSQFKKGVVNHAFAAALRALLLVGVMVSLLYLLRCVNQVSFCLQVFPGTWTLLFEHIFHLKKLTVLTLTTFLQGLLLLSKAVKQNRAAFSASPSWSIKFSHNVWFFSFSLEGGAWSLA